MSHIKPVYLVTTDAIDFISLNHEIASVVRDSGMTDGLVSVIVPKSGAALLVFENLPEVRQSIEEQLKSLVSDERKVKDRLKREISLNSRVQTAMLPRSLTLPLQGGNIVLAPYEEVLLVDCELRGQRREVNIAVAAFSGGKDPDNES